MIEVDIPGYRPLRLEHLVMDYNGTLAVDGALIAGVPERLRALAEKLSLHVVTADTFGKAAEGLAAIPSCRLTVLPPGDQAEAKLGYVQALGSVHVVAVGNGRNDARMLKEAGLGVAVVEGEGAASETLAAADIVCPSILGALDLLLHPLRIKATLRS